jgi:hypothetical protein
MSHPLDRWQGEPIASTDSSLDRRSRNIIKCTNHQVLAEQGRVLHSATVIRGQAYLADEVMSGLDRLRRHEARAAAADPVVADEYAMVRRAMLHAGLDEMERYGRRL